MSDIIIEKSVNDIKEASEQNIWLTGKNKGVKIDDITNDKYLQKIIYILQKREKNAKSLYKNQLLIYAKLYKSIINRANELDIKLKFNFIPIQDIYGDDQLVEECDYFEELFKNQKK